MKKTDLNKSNQILHVAEGYPKYCFCQGSISWGGGSGWGQDPNDLYVIVYRVAPPVVSGISNHHLLI